MNLIRTILLTVLLLPALAIYSQENENAPDTTEGNPFFRGGLEGWEQSLQKNLNPNVPVDNGAPIGTYTVVVQFIVDRNGSVSDVKALTNHGYGMEQEVMRIIKKSPTWTPAIQNERPVRFYRKQHITFTVTKDGVDITTKSGFVFYTDTDNDLTVALRKTKAAHVRLTVSQGTITNIGDGRYIVRVTKPGQLLLTISRKRQKVATASFEVRAKR